jgi:hypothetical protein
MFRKVAHVTSNLMATLNAEAADNADLRRSRPEPADAKPA